MPNPDGSPTQAEIATAAREHQAALDRQKQEAANKAEQDRINRERAWSEQDRNAANLRADQQAAADRNREDYLNSQSRHNYLTDQQAEYDRQRQSRDPNSPYYVKPGPNALDVEKARTSGSISGLKTQGQIQKDLQAQQAAAELAFLNQRASLSDSTWDKRFGQVQGAIGQVGQNAVQHGSAGMQGNEAAARAAAFARAKEQSGRTANSALASLKGMFEDSGTMGSSMEAAQAGQIIGGAGAGVNQFTRDQMISDLARAAEIEDAQYSGNITQRAQDNSMKQALLALMNGGALY